MNGNIHLVAFLTCMLLVIGAESKTASAQSDRWENSLVSPQTVMSMNFNVARLNDNFKNEESRSRFETYVQNRHRIKLSEIDQFQAFISSPQKQKHNADDTFNTKLTFLETTAFDAKTVGGMSRYSLTKSQLGERVAFVGRPDRSGSWGAIVVSDRTLLFAVKRKMDSIIESQKLETPVEHELEGLRKKDVDMCLTLSGGDQVRAIFEESWGTNYFSELFGMYQKGLVYLDTQSTTPLTAELTSKDEKSVRELKGKLEKMLDFAKGFLKTQQSMYERMQKQMKELNWSESYKKRANTMRNSTVQLSAILSSLELVVDGSILRISSKDKAAHQLPEMLVEFMLNQ